MPDLLFNELIERIAKGQVVAVVGAGVSLAATGGAEAAGWGGLLRLGIDRCADVAQPRPASGWADRQRSALDGDLADLLSVAEQVSVRLGAPSGGEFRLFLRETVGALKPRHTGILEALRDLGIPLATTNYDDLLTTVTSRPPVTWRDGSQVERVLRGDDEGIIHLHGFYKEPETVILGIRSYEQILSHEHAQTMQRALASMRTLLFIGCGDGLSDPNFGKLRDWIGKTFAGSEYRHFRLCLTTEREAVEAQHPSEQRTLALSYGDRHDDLAPFLRRLAEAAEKKRPSAGKPATTPATGAPPARLPALPRVFGRDDVVEDIVKSLLIPSPSPIPILGGPGIGKTTVSLAALHDPRVADRFGARRYFVRCDAATTAEALTGEIAQTIGLELGPDLEARVFAWLKEMPAVLMLDNAETPWEADTEAIERLLTDLSCIPGVALLASVRSGQRPLGPAWRETVTVGPLSLGDAKLAFIAIAGTKHSADDLLDTLLGALDGLPLAITLMAYFAEPEPDLSGVWHQWQRERTELLRRPGSMTRLGNIAVSFELSITGRRMTSPARRLLSIAALLPDGIAHTDLNVLLPDEAAKAARVLRAVGLAHDEEGRLRLLAPIREYITVTHSPEEVDWERAVGHYISLARALGPLAGAEGGAEAIVKLASDHANIETVIRFGLASVEKYKAILAAIKLRDFWIFSGFENDKLLESAMTATKDWEDASGLAECIFSLGLLAFSRSDREAARARCEEALPLFRRIGNAQGEANCLHNLGDIALLWSDHDTARALYEEALPLFLQVEDVQGEANCIRSLGDIALARSDHDAARALYEEALPLYRQVKAFQGEANCIKCLGDIALRRSDHDAALAQYLEAQQIYRRIGALQGEANCIERLGDVALLRSDYEVAQAHFEIALKLYECIKDSYSIGATHQRLAHIANDDAKRRSHVATARKVWEAINRTDLIKRLDAEFSVTSKRRRKLTSAAD